VVAPGLVDQAAVVLELVVVVGRLVALVAVEHPQPVVELLLQEQTLDGDADVAALVVLTGHDRAVDELLRRRRRQLLAAERGLVLPDLDLEGALLGDVPGELGIVDEARVGGVELELERDRRLPEPARELHLRAAYAERAAPVALVRRLGGAGDGCTGGDRRLAVGQLVGEADLKTVVQRDRGKVHLEGGAAVLPGEDLLRRLRRLFGHLRGVTGPVVLEVVQVDRLHAVEDHGFTVRPVPELGDGDAHLAGLVEGAELRGDVEDVDPAVLLDFPVERPLGQGRRRGGRHDRQRQHRESQSATTRHQCTPPIRVRGALPHGRHPANVIGVT
jgi:hypothetical protein